MRRMWILAVALAMALAGCADSGTPDTDPDEEGFDDVDLDATDETGVIRGVVVDASIVPIAAATVTLQNLEVSTETNDNGAFGFSDLEPGSYFLEVSKVGYESVQTSAEVQAGVDRPPIIKIQLPANPEELPFVVPLAQELFISCGFKAANYVFDAGWCDPTGNLGMEDRDRSATTFETGTEQGPQYYQSEVTWKANQPASQGLVTIQCARDNTACGSGVGSDRICNVRGASPLICKIAADTPSNTVPGGGNNFTTIRDGEGFGSIFSVGLYSNCAVTCDPVTGVLGVGLALDQEVQAYVHVFYNFQPEDDWLFIEDGPPGVPGS